MKTIVFLEGLPGVGKTTLINYIKERHFNNVHVVDEIINKKILFDNIVDERAFLENEELKFNKYNDGLIVIDRGPISALSYAQTKEIIDGDYDAVMTKKWFNGYKKIFTESCVKIYYLINSREEYKITHKINNSPYGTIENQMLLKSITEFNIKKYCINYIFKVYDKTNIEEVVNEIIN